MPAPLRPARPPDILSSLAAAPIAAFVALTLYDVTINGFWETAALFPDHFDAGAGSLTLILRFFLLVGSVVMLVAWAEPRQPLPTRFVKITAMPALIVIFGWSLTAAERVAPGYDERVFLAVLRDYADQKAVTQADVEKRLGLPVVRGISSKGEDCWSYTYMPSGGFGWRHRLLIFDDRGVLVGCDFNDEP